MTNEQIQQQLQNAQANYVELVASIDLLAGDDVNAPTLSKIDRAVELIDRLERTLAVRAEAKSFRSRFAA